MLRKRMIEVLVNHLRVVSMSPWGRAKNVPAVGDGLEEGHGFLHPVDRLVFVQLLVV